MKLAVDTVPDPVLNEPFRAAEGERLPALLAGLDALTAWHRARCPEYDAMLGAIHRGTAPSRTLADVPWLPVRLFKHLSLRSVPQDQVVRSLHSSGTTGQQVSRIFLDAPTAALQVRALAAIGQDFIGRSRLPMLIIDRRESSSGPAAVRGARAAGVLGFSNFGRGHVHALDADMAPEWDEVLGFVERHGSGPTLLFGFTWVVWRHFLEAAQRDGVRLDFGPRALLVHGGGWKKLADLGIRDDAFKAALADRFGIRRVSNYYGMVEQVGSVFMGCEHGFLHAPAFADVLARDPSTLEVADHGALQVFSLLPRSYPGHAILTEDLGTVHGRDDCPCGRMGARFHVHGRLAQAEARGCSDTRHT